MPPEEVGGLASVGQSRLKPANGDSGSRCGNGRGHGYGVLAKKNQGDATSRGEFMPIGCPTHGAEGTFLYINGLQGRFHHLLTISDIEFPLIQKRIAPVTRYILESVGKCR